ncbi:uncharacterized protein [Ptychodera flava]|uniref:uncharacterized protein n=1 Tax=Ptychodera flava TaxID=63121 RepID=UPI00396A7B50
MGNWDFGLFGCFGDCGLCILTYFLPCVVFGQNAKGVGDSCCMACLCFFVPVGNLICALKTRGKVRARHDISGSCPGDCVTYLFCGLCAIVQEARQLKMGVKVVVPEQSISRD